MLMSKTQRLLEYVNQKLANDLSSKLLGNEYYYYSLPLCVIDAVFSITALYPSVQNVIYRYCSKYELPMYRSPRELLPPVENQETVSDLILKMKQEGVTYFIEKVFVNHSVTSGRKKAEIVLELLETLDRFQIQTFQDIQQWLNQSNQQKKLIDAITSIHGIGEATYRYLLMLCGDEQMVKPDTMILRFIKNAINDNVNEAEAVSLIQAVSKQLLPQYQTLNPRLLDYIIWCWQREQDTPKKSSLCHKKQSEPHEIKPKKNKRTIPTPHHDKLTTPQKTQQAMFKRYQSGVLLSSSKIKDNVLEDYPDTKRSSVMPADYCCNIYNKDPQSGIYHIFFFEKNENKYRLLPESNLHFPRKRGEHS